MNKIFKGKNYVFEILFQGTIINANSIVCNYMSLFVKQWPIELHVIERVSNWFAWEESTWLRHSLME